MNAFDQITKTIDEYADGKHEAHPFYHFEPWDVCARPQWVKDLMVKDGVDIYTEKYITHVGQDPHPFQTGYLMSDVFFRIILAGSKVGKSITVAHEAIIMLTGEIPISMRYDAGVDTKVKRLITPKNILRWGRRDSSTGEIIDHNPNAELPGAWMEWDCGNIIGVGRYPMKKIAPVGSKVWIGCYMKNRDEYWWPKFHDKAEIIVPPHLIDRSRGQNGYDNKDYVIYLTRDAQIPFLTYEQGEEKFEASERAWMCALSEEPKNEEIIQAAQQHCYYLSLDETPYQGISYTEAMIFPAEDGSGRPKKSASKQVFHCCQYDSPYQPKYLIDAMRENMKPWHIAARVWGIHSEQQGDPYYDWEKLHKWRQNHVRGFTLESYAPTMPFFDVVKQSHSILPGLIDVDVVTKKETEDNQLNVWRIFEPFNQSTAYYIVADPSGGGDKPEQAADSAGGMILRPPDPTKRERLDFPRIVGCLRSTLRPAAFAKVILYACRRWNNALLVAETQRHASNGLFAAESLHWPYWYRMVTVREKDQQPEEKIGFDTNASTRGAAFDLIESWINAYSEDQYPDLHDLRLIDELMECVVGKNGRPDHPRNGRLDLSICLGIGIYVLKMSKDQIRCHNFKAVDEEERKKKKAGRWHLQPEKVKAPCGMSAMGFK